MGHFEAKDESKEIRNEDVRDQGIRVLERKRERKIRTNETGVFRWPLG
jgi:hypothetical protein